MTALCVLIIAASGFWAVSMRDAEPDPVTDASTGAAQRLADAEAQRMTRPLSGETLRGYGQAVWLNTLARYGAHEAIDIAARKGDPVTAAKDGQVVAVFRDAVWGGVVEIDHGNGLCTRYAGLLWPVDAIKDKAVKAGETIGRVGTPPVEAEDGPHLHLVILAEGVPAHPSAYSLD